MYVTVLDRAEKMLKPPKYSDEWKRYRFEILNLGNDYMRQVDLILKEYDIEFRPVIFRVKYTNDKSIIDESKVINLDFGFKEDVPYFYIITGINPNLKIELLDLSEVLGCGKFIEDSRIYCLKFEGMYDIFHKLIPFLVSKDSIKGAALERFNDWKEKVYQIEGKGYAKKIT